MNMKLQTRMRVYPIQIDLAGRHFEVTVDKVHDAMGQISWKIRTVIAASVFNDSPGYVNARISFIR